MPNWGALIKDYCEWCHEVLEVGRFEDEQGDVFYLCRECRIDAIRGAGNRADFNP